MPAVELGRDGDGEVELSHRGIRPVGIRHRTDEIAAEADEDLRGARYHRLDRLDTMMAVRTRGFEAEDVADAVEIGLRRFFVDADGAEIGRASWRERVCQYV